MAKHKLINFDACKFFVIDECDKVMGNQKMRSDIQDVFIKTPYHKQVMMFSATMPEEIKKSTLFFMKVVKNSYKMKSTFSSTKES